MDSAERKGSDLRRLLRSADRFNDAAIRLGSRKVNTPRSSVSASLCSVTRRDQRPPSRVLAPAVRREGPVFLPRLAGLRLERRLGGFVVPAMTHHQFGSRFAI
jgi:hypothetical protein